MLAGAGGNITVSIGPDGVLLVDSGLAQMSDQVLAAIDQLRQRVSVNGAPAKPIRYIINTHLHPDHIGGNEKIGEAGKTITGGNVIGDIGDATEGATIVAHEKVLDRLSPNGKPTVSFKALPTLTFLSDQMKLSQFFNGEGIQIFHETRGAHRRRQHRVLPRLRCHQRGRHFSHHQLPHHRSGKRRQLAGHYRRVESHSGSVRRRVPHRRRDAGDPRPRPHLRHRRRRVLSRHGHHRSGPHPRHDQERHDARASEGGQAHRGLGSALRQEHFLDARHVCRGGVQELEPRGSSSECDAY